MVQIDMRGENFDNTVMIMDAKRKRIDTEENKEIIEENVLALNDTIINGPKNVLEAGSGLQARLGPPSSMSVLAWNCRGLGKSRTIRFLKEITQNKKPSIIFLCETLAKKQKIEELCRILHFAEYVAVEVQGRSGGLALLWRNKGGCKVLEATRNFIDFEVEHNQIGRWCYTDFYGFPERNRRRESWDMLRTLKDKSTLPWCVLRDFNDMMYVHEKRGGRSQPLNLLTGFTTTLLDCGLMDLGYVGEKYTWEKSRGQQNWVQERLDRGAANQGCSDLFPLAEVWVIDIATSDHLPLFLSLNRKTYTSKGRRFCFENVWL